MKQKLDQEVASDIDNKLSGRNMDGRNNSLVVLSDNEGSFKRDSEKAGVKSNDHN